MRLGNVVIVAVVIACGFGAGFLWKQGNQPTTLRVSETPMPAIAEAPETAMSRNEHELVLPPMQSGFQLPQVNCGTWPEKEWERDPTFQMVKEHLTGSTIAQASASNLPAIPSLGVDLAPKLDLPVLDPPPIPLPPTVRMPAPSDEPAPRVDRVSCRPEAMWLYTNKRDIRLNFDVTRSGPSGVKAVELWARHRAVDKSNCKPAVQQVKVGEALDERLPRGYVCVDRHEGSRPPFATRLWSEGNYQFRLVFESGTGVKSPAPTCDDPPDLYVCLDTTKPDVEMLPPVSEAPGVIKLRWKATDANLEEMPIRLECSIDGETWRSVTENENWLPNTGEYIWALPLDLPPELHLRVIARDKAGNVGESRSQSKYPIDLTVPEGRISGFVERLPEPREFRPSTRFKTIYVPVFANKVGQRTPLRGIELELTRATITEINQTTPMRLVDDRDSADSELLGTVVILNKNSLNRDQRNEVREGEMVLGVELVWRDLRTLQVLSDSRKPVIFTGRWLPDVGETNAGAQRRVSGQLARKIVHAMESAVLEPSTVFNYPEEQRLVPIRKPALPEMNRIDDPELLPMPRIFGRSADERERSTGVIEGGEEDSPEQLPLPREATPEALPMPREAEPESKPMPRALIPMPQMMLDFGCIQFDVGGRPAPWDEFGKSMVDWMRDMANDQFVDPETPVRSPLEDWKPVVFHRSEALDFPTQRGKALYAGNRFQLQPQSLQAMSNAAASDESLQCFAGPSEMWFRTNFGAVRMDPPMPFSCAGCCIVPQKTIDLTGLSHEGIEMIEALVTFLQFHGGGRKMSNASWYNAD